MASSSVNIKANPRISLVDEVVNITVTGLLPYQSITLVALLEENEKIFLSHAFYLANEYGTVEICKDPSSGGKYTGVEPMGLFWSFKPSSELNPQIRLIKADVSQPFISNIYVIDGYKSILSRNDLLESSHLAKTTVERYYKSPGVIAVPIKTGKVRGMLFIPKGIGPFPGLIDMFGGIGGLIETRAALFASHGFATLALAYFKYDDLPEYMNIQLEYFEEAIDFLSSHPSVSKFGIGVVGICKGATLAMEMAARSQKIKALVAINPAFFHNSGSLYYHGEEQTVYNWSVNKSVEIDREKFYTDEGWSGKDTFQYHLETKEIWEATILIEKSSAECLFISGEDDHSVHPSNLKYIADRLDKFGKTNYKMLSYPGAGHLIEPPYTPLCRASFMKWMNMKFVWGGEPKLHAVAQEHSWHEILKFLEKNLSSTTSYRDVDNLSENPAVLSRL